MSEKQLTVAELLARSGKKPADSSRRRRRSVEEGGISIAELTGNIPKVEAKPASGKHNSDPIDNPATPKSVTAPKPTGVAEKEPKKQTPSQPASYATPAAAKPKVSALHLRWRRSLGSLRLLANQRRMVPQRQQSLKSSELSRDPKWSQQRMRP